MYEEGLRLERENDSLAYEIVTTQVSMQEVITDVRSYFNWFNAYHSSKVFSHVL